MKEEVLLDDEVHLNFFLEYLFKLLHYGYVFWLVGLIVFLTYLFKDAWSTQTP